MVFYRKNRFFFSGGWTWDVVVKWVVNIGPTNRASISQIELHTWRPSPVWEASDGRRYAISSSREPAFPRYRYLLRSPDSTATGTVETINPAVEEFFQLLKDTPRGARKVKITMCLYRDFLPGIEPISHLFGDANILFTMDLPNVMEELREQMSGVEVLWTGAIYKSAFDDAQAAIERFWEIVAVEEEKGTGADKLPVARFVLKRKPIIGLPLAAKHLFEDVDP
jgi:hypothetical protein